MLPITAVAAFSIPLLELGQTFSIRVPTVFFGMLPFVSYLANETQTFLVRFAVLPYCIYPRLFMFLDGVYKPFHGDNRFPARKERVCC